MSASRSLARILPETPFWGLVAHFVKRIVSSDNEEDTQEMSLGLGAVLAILASPGAFASIFLLDKYSSLLQWLRGNHNFNPYRASVADEYFFVVLSMTVTGLVMVMRWNRLFPDKRDFSNLAALPIAIRNVFLANFIALLGLALIFAVDVNAVSALLFPLFVTMAGSDMSTFFRFGASNFVTVMSASLFSFFGVFALVGVMMLVLPKRLFRPASILVRTFLVVALLTEFFSNLFLQLLAGHLPHLREAYARLLPPFWFLGIYESAAGLAKPAMIQLGLQALYALLAAILISLAAYALCYRRHFMRLAESFDVLSSPRHVFRLVLPDRLARLFFRSEFERACAAFALKALVRSERHLMFFGAFLGIGLVMVAQTLADSVEAGAAGLAPGTELLAVPTTIAFFLIAGLRFVFDMPAALNANWIFRLTTESTDPPPVLLARKFMLAATLPWEIFVLAPLTARAYGWGTAALHSAAVMVASVFLTEAALLKFRKIPFTCGTHPDIKRLLFRLLAAILAVTVAVPVYASLERWMLVRPSRFAVLAVLLALGGIALHRYRREIPPDQSALTFEDAPAPDFQFLKLA